MKKFFSILLSFILVISLAVLTITISIGLPIYIRDFYFYIKAFFYIRALSLPMRHNRTSECNRC